MFKFRSSNTFTCSVSVSFIIIVMSAESRIQTFVLGLNYVVTKSCKGSFESCALTWSIVGGCEQSRQFKTLYKGLAKVMSNTYLLDICLTSWMYRLNKCGDNRHLIALSTYYNTFLVDYQK